MSAETSKPRLAVVSPFLDKRHGTERIIAEWISRLVHEFEVHVYSQRVEDVDLSKITWHRIARLPGPHLFNYIWWFLANHGWRTWDRRFRGIHVDLVFSPGVNCLDADVVSVHIVFAEYAGRVAGDLKLRAHRLTSWPQVIHRKLYYRTICSLEKRIYRDPENVLVLMAARTGSQLQRCYGRQVRCDLVHIGLDQSVFNPQGRASLRAKARSELGCSAQRFILLLIGNDWRNKGLPVLLETLEMIRELPVDLLVVGRENPDEYLASIREKHLSGRVQFRQPRADVEFYYAAADMYVGLSLEDAFALPVAEAMACGLPVITSAATGVSEIITNRTDGLILGDPTDVRLLASMIREIFEDEPLRSRLAANAAETARKYTWESSAREFRAVLEEALREKSGQRLKRQRRSK